MSVRFKIPDFELANTIYAAATVTFYTVDASGIKTSTKAALYDAVTGSSTLSNPQTLDSEGKFSAPVYSDVAVIAAVTGLTISDHDTGVIAPSWNFLGAWVTSTIYAVNDVVSITAPEDSAKDGNLYVCSARHTSGTFATDRDTNSYWTEFVDLTLVKDWAKKTGSTVDGTDYSAKERAVGTATRGVAGGGSSKDWASYTAGTVDNADYSAKKHATDASASASAADLSAIAAAASASSIRWHDRAKAATTANITLSAAQTIDGIALVAGDRCLVKDQTAPAENGIYVVAAGAWARATDMDAWAEVPSAALSVEQGTVNADRHYICSSDSGGTLGTTAIAFAQFGAGGINNLVEDSTPQLGGNLDLNGNVITGMVIGTDVLALTGDGSALTGIVRGATTAEKSQIAQNGFLIASHQALSGSNVANGWRDVFTDQTGVDAAGSTNVTYDAVNHLYNNGGGGFTADQIATMTSNTAPSGTASASSEYDASHAAWKAMDDAGNAANTSSWVAGATGYPQTLAYDFGTAKTIAQFTILDRGTHADQAPKDFTFEGWNGSAWVVLDTFTGQTYTDGVTKTFSSSNTTAYNKYQLNISADGGGGQAAIGEWEMMASLATSNMTLISNATTALSTPTSATIMLWEEDVAVITLNTDLKAWVSRDGGTTWTQITLTKSSTLITGQLLTGTVDISAQPAGTAMKYKIETLNAKELKIHGVQMSWS